MKNKFLAFILALFLIVPCGVALSACKQPGEERTIYFNVGTTLYATEKSSGYEVISLPENPTKEGYSFKGWYLDSKLTEKFDNKKYVESAIPQNLSVYAKFTINQYTISFDTNGADQTSVEAITKNYGEAVLAPEVSLTKANYTFAGWKQEGKAELYTFTTMPAQNITLVAQWEEESYAINYFDQDGSAITGLKTSYSVLEGLVTLQNPTKEGYQFEGWYLEEGLVNRISSFDGSLYRRDMNFYAKFTVMQFTLTVNPNNGSQAIESDLAYGAEIELPDLTNASYAFAGWFIDSDCTVEFNLTTMPASDVTVYAKWDIAQYNLFLEARGAVSMSISSSKFTVLDSKYTLQAPNAAVLGDGFEFGGWYTDEALTNEIEEFDPSQYSADVTLYAKIVAKTATITFVVNNQNAPAGYEVEEITEPCGSAIVLPTPTIEGYTFDGWFTEAEGGTQVSITEMPDEDTILYAHWTQNV